MVYFVYSVNLVYILQLREHSIFSVVLTEAVAPYYVEAWRRASVNTLEKIECSLSDFPSGQCRVRIIIALNVIKYCHTALLDDLDSN